MRGITLVCTRSCSHYIGAGTGNRTRAWSMATTNSTTKHNAPLRTQFRLEPCLYDHPSLLALPAPPLWPMFNSRRLRFCTQSLDAHPGPYPILPNRKHAPARACRALPKHRPSPAIRSRGDALHRQFKRQSRRTGSIAPLMAHLFLSIPLDLFPAIMFLPL